MGAFQRETVQAEVEIVSMEKDDCHMQLPYVVGELQCDLLLKM